MSLLNNNSNNNPQPRPPSVAPTRNTNMIPAARRPQTSSSTIMRSRPSPTTVSIIQPHHQQQQQQRFGVDNIDDNTTTEDGNIKGISNANDSVLAAAANSFSQRRPASSRLSGFTVSSDHRGEASFNLDDFEFSINKNQQQRQQRQQQQQHQRQQEQEQKRHSTASAATKSSNTHKTEGSDVDDEGLALMKQVAATSKSVFYEPSPKSLRGNNSNNNADGTEASTLPAAAENTSDNFNSSAPTSTTTSFRRQRNSTDSINISSASPLLPTPITRKQIFPVNSRPSSAAALLATYQDKNQEDRNQEEDQEDQEHELLRREGKSTDKKNAMVVVNPAPAPPQRRPLSRTVSYHHRQQQQQRQQNPSSVHHSSSIEQTNHRRFFAIETNGRSQVLSDESDARSVLTQWFSAVKYQVREKEHIRMRLPSQELVDLLSSTTITAATSEKNKRATVTTEEVRENENEQTQSPSSKYVSYTERTGRTWGTRMKQPPNMITSSENNNNNDKNNNNKVSSFEEKLLQSKFAEAFEVDGTLLPQYQKEQEEKRLREQELLLRKKSPQQLEQEAHASQERRHLKQQVDLIDEETRERQNFISAIFTPELLRCVEDAERIERFANEEKRRTDLERICSGEYSRESKPLMEAWRKREHATLTLQCAFRKIQRESFGWRRTHKQIGYEIETERRNKKKRKLEQELLQEQKQQREQERKTSVSSNTSSNPRHHHQKQRQLSQSREIFSKSANPFSSSQNQHHQQQQHSGLILSSEEFIESIETAFQKEHEDEEDFENELMMLQTPTNTDMSKVAQSVRVSNSIRALELEGKRKFKQQQQHARAQFLKSVAKQRDDVAYEEKWVLQRELQFMSSRFFDDVTKPGMARVAQEEAKARSSLIQNDHDNEFAHLRMKFEFYRDQIQTKNDLEKLEGSRRQLLEVSEINGLAKIGDAHDVNLGETIKAVLRRFKRERSAIEDAESKRRQSIDTEMVNFISEIFAWHCSVTDDSLATQERAARTYLTTRYVNKINEWFSHGIYGANHFMTLDFLRSLDLLHLEGRLETTSIVFEPLARSSIAFEEAVSRKWLMASIRPQAAEISAGSDKRVTATRKIQRFWRLFKLGEVGRSGRIKFYDQVFAAKKKAAAQKRMRKMIEQTQADLENALRAANIHIVAGFSQKIKILEKQEARERRDIETDDGLMRRIFDANMVSAIAQTCSNETTVLARFEAYHRFEIQKEERDVFSKYKTFMQLVFWKDVKIRPAQRAIRCHQARNARRRRIKEALIEVQEKEHAKRTTLMIEEIDQAASLFGEVIITRLYRASFSDATFIWIQQQEFAARQLIIDERDKSSRGYLGWLASLDHDTVTEEQHDAFRNTIVAAWKQDMISLDLFSLEISERRTVISHQSEIATKNLLAHVESMQRLFMAQTAERQNFELAVSSLELNESTNRTAIQKEAINIGFSLLLHRQESAQRSILQKHLLKLLSSNSTIQQQESEARDEILRDWSVGFVSCFNTYEQNTRFSLMTNEFLTRERLRFFASEDDWRTDTEASRRYEILMLVELAETSRRKTFLNREMKYLEDIVDFNRQCIKKKGLMFENDYCHGMRAILEAQQHAQRKLISQDERDAARALYQLLAVAQQLQMVSKEKVNRAKLYHFQNSKFDWIMKYHVKLTRNENFRAADNVWRTCAARALYAVDQFNEKQHQKQKSSRNSNNDTSPQKQLEYMVSTGDVFAGTINLGSTTNTINNKNTIASASASSPTASPSPTTANKNRDKNRELIIRAMSNELIRATSQLLIPVWQRQLALELSTQYLQLLGPQMVEILQTEISFIQSTMDSALARDPYFQTMYLVHERNLKAKEIWQEQASELATNVDRLQDSWVLPFYESVYNTGVQSAFTNVKELESRELVSLHATQESTTLFNEEFYFRTVISITEQERKARSEIQQEEVQQHSDIVIIYQDTILKPLQTLRHEKELRRQIEQEELVALSEIVRQFEEEFLYQLGPQRAWTLQRRQEDLRIRGQKIADPTFLDIQERQAKRREEFEAINDPEERKKLALHYLQKWAQNNLWCARATRTDPLVAAAFAITDVLQEEDHAAIDIRDRFEKLRYSSILIQKLFRGYRARNPNLDERIEKTRAFKQALRKQHALEEEILQQQATKQRRFLEERENEGRGLIEQREEPRELDSLKESESEQRQELIEKEKMIKQQQQEQQHLTAVEAEKNNTQAVVEEQQEVKKSLDEENIPQAAPETKQENEIDVLVELDEEDVAAAKARTETAEAVAAADKRHLEEAKVKAQEEIQQEAKKSADEKDILKDDEEDDVLGDLDDEL